MLMMMTLMMTIKNLRYCHTVIIIIIIIIFIMRNFLKWPK